ncbi:hypothetical protein SADUNF_Sadunf18G0031900 [Salix dunnii]|uniref:Uncharacterized protein n=1 Tax=Salix dunnii TaxID=1413687 RepID=A0A835J2E1_9ROSI|nr:hypothetical protein SADUNF_Sadunf18G0031900 [Salix dunnii]
MNLPISMVNNEAGDKNSISGDHGVEALWAGMEETWQQVAQIHEMLATGANINASNSPPINKARAKGCDRGQRTDRRRNPAPHIQNDSEDDSDEGDDKGYGLAHLQDDRKGKTITI